MKSIVLFLALLAPSIVLAGQTGEGSYYGTIQDGDSAIDGFDSPSSGCYRFWDESTTGVCFCWTGNDWNMFEYDCSTPAPVVASSFSSSAADPADSGVLLCGNAETCVAAESAPAGTDGTLTYSSGEVWESNSDMGIPQGEYLYLNSPTNTTYIYQQSGGGENIYIRNNGDDIAALKASESFFFTDALTLFTESSLRLGSYLGSNYSAFYADYSTNNFVLGLNAAHQRILVVADVSYLTSDFDHGTETNPAIVVQAGDPDSDNTLWVKIAHDQTDGVISTGAGDLNLSPNTGIVVSDAFSSDVADSADAGVFRMGNTECIAAELATPGADGTICFNSSDMWAFNSDITIPSGSRLYMDGATGNTSIREVVAGTLAFYTSGALRLSASSTSISYFNASDTLEMNLWRDDLTASDDDEISSITGRGRSEPSNDTQIYSTILTTAQDVTDATEDSKIDFEVMTAGTNTVFFTIDGENTKNTSTVDIEHVVEPKGATTTITGNYKDLTCTGDDATLTTSGLIPDNAFLKFVTTRITTALTTDDGMTGFDVGDGSDQDLFGTASAITQGTTTADVTANIGNPQYAAGEVTLTFTGGLCDSGTVRVVAHYDTFAAPTSN